MPNLESSQVHRTNTPYSQDKYAFLHCLQADLRRIGIAVSMKWNRNQLGFMLRPVALKTGRIVKLMRDERDRRLHAEREFLTRALSDGITEQFAIGSSLDFDSINPKIEFCASREELETFRFCRLLQSVPAPRLLYRQIAALVRDEGQPGTPLIGAFGLSSTVYSLTCRDQFLGWSTSTRARHRGLRSCMQLSFCIAVPPYSFLRAGKMIAGLAASDSVAAEFFRKYRPDNLKSIVTTSANGLHSPIYNRIMVRPGGLYRRIGETMGYSTLAFSRDTLLAARALVIKRDGSCPDNRAIRTLKRALNICDIPRDKIVRLGIRKGVYLTVPYLHNTREGGRPVPAWPGEIDVVRYWKERVLSKAMLRPDIIEKASQFRAADFVTNFLDEIR